MGEEGQGGFEGMVESSCIGANAQESKEKDFCLTAMMLHMSKYLLRHLSSLYVVKTNRVYDTPAKIVYFCGH